MEYILLKHVSLKAFYLNIFKNYLLNKIEPIGIDVHILELIWLFKFKYFGIKLLVSILFEWKSFNITKTC